MLNHIIHSPQRQSSSFDSLMFVPSIVFCEHSAKDSVRGYVWDEQTEKIEAVAETGTDALRMVQAGHYDVINLDMNLGEGMVGIEAARLLRSLSHTKDVPIIDVKACNDCLLILEETL